MPRNSMTVTSVYLKYLPLQIFPSYILPTTSIALPKEHPSFLKLYLEHCIIQNLSFLSSLILSHLCVLIPNASCCSTSFLNVWCLIGNVLQFRHFIIMPHLLLAVAVKICYKIKPLRQDLAWNDGSYKLHLVLFKLSLLISYFAESFHTFANIRQFPYVANRSW